MHVHRINLAFLALAVCLPLSAHGDDTTVDYTRDIRPLLSNHCYACHGPDKGQRKADLRLDVRDVAIADAIERELNGTGLTFN